MLLDTRNFNHSSQLSGPHHVKRPPSFTTDDRQFEVYWADCEDDVRDAQRLRYRVFAQEMGARLTPPVGTAAGLDADRFDAYCDHVLVRLATLPGAAPGMLVGTYRVLAPGAARRAGGFYTDTEFDLAPLKWLRAHAVELGRSCVHADWRFGGVIMALWTALGDYMQTHRLKNRRRWVSRPDKTRIVACNPPIWLHCETGTTWGRGLCRQDLFALRLFLEETHGLILSSRPVAAAVRLIATRNRQPNSGIIWRFT